MNKLSMSLIAGSTLLCSSLFAVDNVDRVQTPPAGLDSMNIPQLICLGFDDNRYSDGVSWVVDTLLVPRRRIPYSLFKCLSSISPLIWFG